MRKVDLNADLGESFGAYSIGMDEEVIQYISSANVACGWHAGDATVMDRTVRNAAKAGVRVGAHPGYPDLLGFGRRPMSISPDEGRAYIQYQVGALWAFARGAGVELQHVKPHGALYNTAAKDRELALALCEGVRAVDPKLIFMGLAGSELLRAAEEVGLRAASEVFADRAYMPDGNLAPRSMPGSVLHDREFAIRRTVRMVKEGVVTAIDGTDIPIRADSICVHGDNRSALEFVEGIRAALTAEGIEICSLAGILQ